MNAIIQTDGRYQQIESILNGLTSEHSRRVHKRTLTEFVNWHPRQGQPVDCERIQVSFMRDSRQKNMREC